MPMIGNLLDGVKTSSLTLFLCLQLKLLLDLIVSLVIQSNKNDEQAKMLVTW